MLLYPTETIYALGVNALDKDAVGALFAFKGRDVGKSASWLVRGVADIEKYAVLSNTARSVAKRYLPGPLTLVLPARYIVPEFRREPDGEVSFRISSDPIAQKVIADFMAEHDAPLTCTSANVAGLPTCDTPAEIVEQFTEAGRDVDQLDIVDGAERTGEGSTVVRIIDDQIEVLRQGSIVIE